MEATYSDNENGGAFKRMLYLNLQNWHRLMRIFREKVKIKWRIRYAGATWTMGAMFAQTSGLPLSISIDDNAMDTQDTFFKDTTTLGDILQKKGIHKHF